MAVYRIRPSKPASVVGMVVGLLFVGFGLLVAVPMAGAFGIVWTLVAVAIVAFNAVNVFSRRGIAGTEIDTDGEHLPSSGGEPLPFDERLRRLEKLRADGLVSAGEYERKRAELMGERW
jgi:hypothetical protein